MAIPYIVIASHRSNYPNPIQFVKGETLVLGKRDTEYPGWVWVTTPSEKDGWAPEPLIERTSINSGTALSEYTARELDTQVGDLVSCVKELHGWLWVEKENGESGWVPKESVGAA